MGSQCYLPPGRGDIPALTPAEAGTRLSDPGWMPELTWVMTKPPQSCVTHTRLTALFPGLPRWDCTRKAKPIWILLKQETVSGSGISWAVCKSAPRYRQTTMPAPHHSVFYRPDALPAAQPTAEADTRLSDPGGMQGWVSEATALCSVQIVTESIFSLLA